jgi:hypothetical protein
VNVSLAKIARRASAAVVLGVIVGWAGFALTSTTPPFTYLGPLCRERTIEDPHFDPWTGEARSGSFVCNPANNPGVMPGPRTVVDIPPDELLGRFVVPIPAGFALGSLGTIGWFVVSDRRRASAAW